MINLFISGVRLLKLGLSTKKKPIVIIAAKAKIILCYLIHRNNFYRTPTQ